MLSEVAHVVGVRGGVAIALLSGRVKCAALCGKDESSIRRGKVDMLRCVGKSLALCNGDRSPSGVFGGGSIAIRIVAWSTLLRFVGIPPFEC